MPNVFCDMDGVLADFDNAYKEVCGVCITTVNHLPDPERWGKIAQVHDFWETIKPMPDAAALIDYLRFNVPYEKRYVLSAHMEYHPTCVAGKIKWLNKHAPIFSWHQVNIIARHKKCDYAVKPTGEPNILIDDYIKNIREWEAAGGIGIYHTNLPETLDKLSAYY